MTPDDFGVFNALNSMIILLATPTSMLPIILSRFTVQFSLESMEKVRALLYSGLKWIFLVSVMVFATGLLSFGLIKNFLKIIHALPVVIMLTHLSIVVLIPVPVGILQGLQRFLGFSLVRSIPMLTRFLFGLAFVLLLGWGVNGAMLAGLLGAAMSLAFGAYFLKDTLKGPRAPLPEGTPKKMAWFTLPVLLTSMFVMALGNLDLILVRHFCSPENSGMYASAAVLGRIALFLPGMLIMVLFPSAAKGHSTGQKDTKSLWVSLGLTGLLGGGFALAASIFPETIVGLLFGFQYIESASMFRLIAIAMALLAMARVVFTYCLACSEYGYLWILGLGVAGMLSLVLVFHAHPIQIAWILFGTTSFILTGTVVWFWWIEQKSGLREMVYNIWE